MLHVLLFNESAHVNVNIDLICDVLATAGRQSCYGDTGKDLFTIVNVSQCYGIDFSSSLLWFCKLPVIHPQEVISCGESSLLTLKLEQMKV